MTYNVFRGMLNPTQSNQYWPRYVFCLRASGSVLRLEMHRNPFEMHGKRITTAVLQRCPCIVLQQLVFIGARCESGVREVLGVTGQLSDVVASHYVLL